MQDLCLTDKELEFREDERDTRKRDRTQASEGVLNSLSGIGGWVIIPLFFPHQI